MCGWCSGQAAPGPVGWGPGTHGEHPSVARPARRGPILAAGLRPPGGNSASRHLSFDANPMGNSRTIGVARRACSGGRAAIYPGVHNSSAGRGPGSDLGGSRRGLGELPRGNRRRPMRDRVASDHEILGAILNPCWQFVMVMGAGFVALRQRDGSSPAPVRRGEGANSPLRECATVLSRCGRRPAARSDRGMIPDDPRSVNNEYQWQQMLILRH